MSNYSNSRYRLWHFTGTLLQQINTEENKELREAIWVPVPKGTYPPRQLNYRAAQAMAAQAAPAEGELSPLTHSPYIQL